MKLFYDEKTGLTYTENFPYVCEECEQEIQKQIFISQFRNSRNQEDIKLFCMGCLNKVSKKGLQTYHTVIGVYNSNYIVQLVNIESIPRKIKIINLSKPLYLQTTKTVYEASQLTRGEADTGVVIEDNTKLTGNNSLEGASIGVMPEEKLKITDNNIKDFLLSQKKGKRDIPEHLEDKR